MAYLTTCYEQLNAAQYDRGRRYRVNSQENSDVPAEKRSSDFHDLMTRKQIENYQMATSRTTSKIGMSAT
jgi:hypothetical protein